MQMYDLDYLLDENVKIAFIHRALGHLAKQQGKYIPRAAAGLSRGIQATTSAVGNSVFTPFMKAMSGSHRWQKGVIPKILGDDLLGKGMTLGAAAAGAREGYEVGGVSGALVGGLGAGAGMRISHGAMEAVKRGLIGPRGVITDHMLKRTAQNPNSAWRFLRGGQGAFRQGVGNAAANMGKGFQNAASQMNDGWMKRTTQYMGNKLNTSGTSWAQSGANAAKRNLEAGSGQMPMWMHVGGSLAALPAADWMAGNVSRNLMDTYKQTVGSVNQKEQERRSYEDQLRNRVDSNNVFSDFKPSVDYNTFHRSTGY